MRRDRGQGVVEPPSLTVDWRAALVVACVGVIATVVSVFAVDSDRWRSGLLLAGGGLWLVVAAPFAVAAVSVAYRPMFCPEVVVRRNDGLVGLATHPVRNAARWAPVLAPVFVLVVGRGRRDESAEALLLALVAQCGLLETFRRHAIIVKARPTAVVDDGVALYWQGALTIALATAFLIIGAFIHSGRIEVDAFALLCAAGSALATAAAYLGLLAGWVPSTPVRDVPLRLVVFFTWPLLASAALVDANGWRPLQVSLAACAVFVIVNEPIRRRVAAQQRGAKGF